MSMPISRVQTEGLSMWAARFGLTGAHAGVTFPLPSSSSVLPPARRSPYPELVEGKGEGGFFSSSVISFKTRTASYFYRALEYVWPVRNIRIDGASMAPTLFNGDSLLAVRAFPHLVKPRVGQVVIFEHRGQMLIKRIMEIDGDKVSVVGDNLRQSWDSRDPGFGPVFIRDIRYVAIERSLPPRAIFGQERWHTLVHHLRWPLEMAAALMPEVAARAIEPRVEVVFNGFTNDILRARLTEIVNQVVDMIMTTPGSHSTDVARHLADLHRFFSEHSTGKRPVKVIFQKMPALDHPLVITPAENNSDRTTVRIGIVFRDENEIHLNRFKDIHILPFILYSLLSPTQVYYVPQWLFPRVIIANPRIRAVANFIVSGRFLMVGLERERPPDLPPGIAEFLRGLADSLGARVVVRLGPDSSLVGEGGERAPGAGEEDASLVALVPDEGGPTLVKAVRELARRAALEIKTVDDWEPESDMPNLRRILALARESASYGRFWTAGSLESLAICLESPVLRRQDGVQFAIGLIHNVRFDGRNPSALEMWKVQVNAEIARVRNERVRGLLERIVRVVDEYPFG